MLSMDSKDGKCRVCMYVNPMILWYESLKSVRSDDKYIYNI